MTELETTERVTEVVQVSNLLHTSDKLVKFIKLMSRDMTN